MPLDLTGATAERWSADGADLDVWWVSRRAPGTFFQVYVDGVLSWWGTSARCTVPLPPGGQRVLVAVGSVGPGEEHTDFSASLPAPPGGGDRAALTWYGGRWESEELVGFHVYAAAAAGGPVDYTRPVATVPARRGARWGDGFGVGPFGVGGFGRSALTFSWTSPHMGNGVWAFGVRSFDDMGNEVNGCVFDVALTAPPQPPARDDRGLRLTYTWQPSTDTVTLDWLPSPG